MSTRKQSAFRRLSRLFSDKSDRSSHSYERTSKLRLEYLEPRLALRGIALNFEVQNPLYNASNTYVTFIGGTINATYDGYKSIELNHSYTISELNGAVQLNLYTNGRIFVSLGAGVSGVYPPEITNPDIPSYWVRHDKIEIDYDPTDVNSCTNLTAVDYSAIPLQLKTYMSSQLVDVLSYYTAYDTIKSEIGALSNNNTNVVLYNGSSYLRTVSPKVLPDYYASMQTYVDMVKTSHISTSIVGTYDGVAPFSTPATQAQTYNFTSTILSDGSLQMVGSGSVVGDNHTIIVPVADLYDGIYSGNPTYWTVDGVADSFANNDVYCAALRDMLSGFNLGFVGSQTVDPATNHKFGEEASSNWWSSPKAFSYLQSNPLYYNQYADIITSNSSAYSWAFSDRWSHVLANLNQPGQEITNMQLVVLPDGATSGPTIGSVAIVADKGLMTWNVQDGNGLRSSTLKIDGTNISKVYGPYTATAGWNYSGVFGILSTGPHTYTITATDNLGYSSQKSGTFDAVAGDGPTIGSIAIVAAQGLMTWNAQDIVGVASSALQVDGVSIWKIYGPYNSASGSAFSGIFGTLSAGTHSYTITATNTIGCSSQSSGTFTAPTPSGPTIGSIVVVSAQGVMTWNAQDASGVTGTTLQVDGTNISKVYGPYSAASGVDYAGDFGQRSAGTHHYMITATNTSGSTTTALGTFNVAALMIDSLLAPQGKGQLLFDEQIAPIAAEAMRRMQTQWGNQVDEALAGVSIKVANLPDGMLGEADGKTIWLDDDAAGYGWFVDPTPADDLEFAKALAVEKDSAASERVDLLTVVMHEMGHVLGFDHSTSLDLMNATLPIGTRRSLS